MNNYLNIEPPSVSDVTQTLIFKTIWARIPAKSFISGLWLRSYVNTPLWANCFLRVLSVQKYRYFKYYFGNIILTTPGEKGLWEQGSEEERIQYALSIEENSKGKTTADWKAVKSLESDLMVLYKKHFPTTRGMVVNYQYDLEEQKHIIGKLNKEFWEGFK